MDRELEWLMTYDVFGNTWCPGLLLSDTWNTLIAYSASLYACL